MGQFTDATDVVEMQMRDDRFPYVSRRVARQIELPGQRIVRTDVESERPASFHSSFGKLPGLHGRHILRHRCAVPIE